MPKFVQIAVCEKCDKPVATETPIVVEGAIKHGERVIASEGAYHLSCLLPLLTVLGQPVYREPVQRGAPLPETPVEVDAPVVDVTLDADEFADPDFPGSTSLLSSAPTPRAAAPTRAPTPSAVPTGAPIVVGSKVMLTAQGAAANPRFKRMIGVVTRFLTPSLKDDSADPNEVQGIYVDFPTDGLTLGLEDVYAVTG